MLPEQAKRLVALFLLIILLLVFIGIFDSVIRGMSLYDSIITAVYRILGASGGAEGLGKGFLSLAMTFVAASAVYYVIYTLIDFFLDIRFGDMLMMNKISMLKDHYIVCGAGRVGSTAAEKLHEMKKSFVIIEKDCSVADELKRRYGYLVLVGDCTDEYILKKVGVGKARGIICALGDNEDNFYLIITARHMNAKIKVAARANSEGMGKKMKAVGADIIVTPEVVGGRKLATGLAEI